MNIKFLIPLVSLISACTSMDMPPPPSTEMIYPIYTPEEAKPLPHFVKTSEVPQAHVSAKNQDIAWVEDQPANHLTIMLASDTKPLPVSTALLDAPKAQHGAVLKYEKNGQVYYSGVYGSFMDQENAKAAIEQLPEHLKNNARVVEWAQMQHLNFI